MKTESITYAMSKDTFQNIIKNRAKGDKKENPHRYVIDLINREFGLKGIVTKLHVI